MFFRFLRKIFKRRQKRCPHCGCDHNISIPNPGFLQLDMKEIIQMPDVINFTVLLPELTDVGDVEGGELTVVVDGGDPQVVATTVDQTEVTGLSGAQGAVVDLSFVYVDDAGNKSDTPATLQVTLEDTVPPQNPESLGVRIEGEV